MVSGNCDCCGREIESEVNEGVMTTHCRVLLDLTLCPNYHVGAERAVREYVAKCGRKETVAEAARRGFNSR